MEELAAPPLDPDDKKLWLQHAAGYIAIRDVRGYARDQIPVDLPPKERAAAEKGIDDALYGLMMVADGVGGKLFNEELGLELRVQMRVELVAIESDEVLDKLDLSEGDGACMGFHMWMENDFGEHSIVIDNQR